MFFSLFRVSCKRVVRDRLNIENLRAGEQLGYVEVPEDSVHTLDRKSHNYIFKTSLDGAVCFGSHSAGVSVLYPSCTLCKVSPSFLPLLFSCLRD